MGALDLELEGALRLLESEPGPPNELLPRDNTSLSGAFSAWRREHIEVLERGTVMGATSGDLFRAFNAWASDCGYPVFPKVIRSWGAHLKSLGLTKGRRWCGYREERPFFMNGASALYWAAWLRSNPRPLIDPLFDVRRKAQ